MWQNDAFNLLTCDHEIRIVRNTGGGNAPEAPPDSAPIGKRFWCRMCDSSPAVPGGEHGLKHRCRRRVEGNDLLVQ